MRVFAISDLHLSLCGEKPMEIFGNNWDNYLEIIKEDWKSKVTEDDVVVIGGDISWAMKMEGFEVDLQYITELPGKKIIIRGNHDYWWSSLTKVRNVLPKNMFALQNDCVKIENIVFCGTRGWLLTPEEEQDEKILARELIRAEMSLQTMQRIKKEGDKVVFIIHYPPLLNRKSSEFTKLFEKYGVDCVVFGHLHGIRSDKFIELNSIKYYLTSTDMVGHKLVEIDI